MIRNATQLKAMVRNLSGSDSNKALMLIRNYFMQRFLERIAQSEYRDHFILKGGMLVASLVGLNTRATMDIDTTAFSGTCFCSANTPFPNRNRFPAAIRCSMK